MHVKSKTLVKAYSKLSEISTQYAEFAEQTAARSFYDNSPTLVLCERIAELYEKSNLAALLKAKIKNAFKMLDEEELKILACWKRGNREGLFLSERSYFRKLSRTFTKLESALKIQGVTDEAFKKVYSAKLVYIKTLASIYEVEAQGIAKRLKSLKINRSFSSSLKSKGSESLNEEASYAEVKGDRIPTEKEERISTGKSERIPMATRPGKAAGRNGRRTKTPYIAHYSA